MARAFAVPPAAPRVACGYHAARCRRAPATRAGTARPSRPVLVLALRGGLLANPASRLSLIAALSSPTTLLVVLGLDIILLLYRVIAVVDAFRVADAARSFAEAGTTRLGRPRVHSHPLAIAGLVAVLLVTSLGHAAAGRHGPIAHHPRN